jgi:hypothetical protein
LISGKQIHYLVPLFPSFALLSGHLLSREQKGGLWLPALVSGLIGAAMIYFALAGLPDKLGVTESLPWWPGMVLIAVALIPVWAGRTPDLRLPALAILGAALFALVQFYISPGAGPSYDMHPMAKTIRQLQDRGIPVANIGKYHAQFQFAGRLEQPITQLNTNELPAWLEKNPDGAVVVYVSRKREPAEFLFSQPYRGETAVLLSADQARAQADLFGKKGKPLNLPGGDGE